MNSTTRVLLRINSGFPILQLKNKKQNKKFKKLQKNLKINNLFIFKFYYQIPFAHYYKIELPILDLENSINWRCNPLQFYKPEYTYHLSNYSSHPLLSNTIRLGMCNIQSLLHHSIDLSSFILDHKISVCAISESRIKENRGPGHPFIKAYNYECEKTFGNAMAFHPDLLNYSVSFIQLLNKSQDTITMRVLNFIITAVYLPPRNRDEIEISLDFDNPFVRQSDFILGDFNTDFNRTTHPRTIFMNLFLSNNHFSCPTMTCITRTGNMNQINTGIDHIFVKNDLPFVENINELITWI